MKHFFPIVSNDSSGLGAKFNSGRGLDHFWETSLVDDGLEPSR